MEVDTVANMEVYVVIDIKLEIKKKQARKPRSYASPKLCPLANLLTDRGKV